MPRILIATSNPGKLRDFAAAAAAYSLRVEPGPGFDLVPSVAEDAPTFSGNARKKAQHYSLSFPEEIILADDSGLEVDALGGAPGVLSARYAATAELTSPGDAANNARLLRELQHVADEKRAARFVCVIVAAQGGRTLASFEGEARGLILRAPRGTGGFGYDPLFYFPSLQKTFAELSPAEKTAVSHRGQAFRKFLEWWKGRHQPSAVGRQPSKTRRSC